MRYRKLTSTGDMPFGNQQLDFYRDVPEAVGQAVETRLRLWLGEWYLNILSGTLFMQGILGKKSQTKADVTIQQRVINTQGVTDISNYESSLDANSRALSVKFDIDTQFGPTKVEIANYVNY